MRKTISIIAVTGALTFGATPAFAMEEECSTTIELGLVEVTPATPYIPAVPPVYETIVEYEYQHRRAEATRWEREGWNAEENPQSFGFVWTGNTREVVTDTVLVPGVPEVPGMEAVFEEREIPVTVCAPVLPEEPVVEQPAPPAEPVKEQPAPVQAPETAVRTAVEAPAAAPVAAALPVSAHPAELAYTGAADWVFPASLGMLAAGTGLVALRRKLGAA